MKASIIENQIIYGIDLSARGATVIDISDEDFEMVKSGQARWDGESIIPIEQEEPTEEQLAAQQEKLDQEALVMKKQEMLNLIESRYSIQDQLYILMNELGAGDNTGFDDMLEFVRSMFAEFKKNGKDSDFSKYME